jgi:hypothetical protein
MFLFLNTMLVFFNFLFLTLLLVRKLALYCQANASYNGNNNIINNNKKI